jgi:hypothetical protein
MKRAMLLFIFSTAALLVAQDKSSVTVKSSALNNHVILVDLVENGKNVELQCYDIHVSLVSRKNTRGQARSRESAHFPAKIFSSHLVPLGCGPCVRRTGHPFAASSPRGPSQKIELVFSASPETVSGEPKERFGFRRSLGQGGTWQPARALRS